MPAASRGPRGPRRPAATLAAILAAVVATGGAAALDTGAAHADTGDVVVTKHDPRGDVRVLPARGPGKVARASVDLRSFSLTERSAGAQMDIVLRRILTNSKYEQVVEVQMRPSDHAETWFLAVTMDGQEPVSASATYSPDLTGDPPVTCDSLDTAVDPDADTLSVLVPDACLPTTAAKIRVYSSLVRTDHEAYATDRMLVHGSYLVDG